MKRTAIVIGAGAAGLTAAYTLKRRGYDVTLLEALDRLGGRIHALTGFASYPIELGAETVNGFGHRLHRWAARNRTGVLRPDLHGQEYYWIHNRLHTDVEFRALPVAAEANRLWSALLSHKGDEMNVADYLFSRDASPEATSLIKQRVHSRVRDDSRIGERERDERAGDSDRVHGGDRPPHAHGVPPVFCACDPCFGRLHHDRRRGHADNA